MDGEQRLSTEAVLVSLPRAGLRYLVLCGGTKGEHFVQDRQTQADYFAPTLTPAWPTVSLCTTIIDMLHYVAVVCGLIFQITFLIIIIIDCTLVLCVVLLCSLDKAHNVSRHGYGPDEASLGHPHDRQL